MIALAVALLLQSDLVEKLQSDDVEVRDGAERELVKMGEAALPALKKALEGEKEAEPRARLASVIAKIEKPMRYRPSAPGWRLRIEADTCRVELRGDGTGVAVSGRWAQVLAPTREQLEALAAKALAADLLDRDEPRRDIDFKTDAEWTLVVESCGVRRAAHVDLRMRSSPAALKRIVLELHEAFDRPELYQGRSVATLIDEFMGPDGDAARRAARALRSAAWGIEPFLRDSQRPFNVRERLKTLLVQDPADLVEKLRADDVAVRDGAERELVKMGEAALPALKRALEAEKEVEPRVRLESVVAKIEKRRRYGCDRAGWTLRLERQRQDSSTLMRVDTVEVSSDGCVVVEIDLNLWVAQTDTETYVHLAMKADVLDQPSGSAGWVDLRSVGLRTPGREHVVRWGSRDKIADGMRDLWDALAELLAKPDRLKWRTLPDLMADVRGGRTATVLTPLARVDGRARVALRGALRTERDDVVRERLTEALRMLDAQEAAPLVEQLRSDEVAVRDAAERELVKRGETALPMLRKALEGEKEAEPRARLASVIAKIEKPMRYGRGKTTWRMRVTFDVTQPEPRTWFAEISGDGTGVSVPWGREVRAFALAPTREQLDEAIELAMAADVLDGEFAAVESEARMPPEATCDFRFENGPHARTIRVRAPRDTIPEPLRKLLYFIQGPLADPAKMKGRAAGELAADLRGPGAEGAEKLFRRMGKAAVPGLQRALSAEQEESVRTRIEKLIEDLKK